MKIGVVLGSVREGRIGNQVAQWVMGHVQSVAGHEFELVDLKEFNLPVYSSEKNPMMCKGNYDVPEQQAWGSKMAEFDAYIVVTPEYNHGIPGALKNAIDSLGIELLKKRIGFVGYGFAGGVRAVEQLRQVVANFSMFDIRAQVALDLNTELKDGILTPGAHQVGMLQTLVDQLTEKA